jgi:hypothetical protein
MAEAAKITGYSRWTITTAAKAGDIPGAIHRLPKSPWYFTPEGLRSWIGIPEPVSA